MKKKILYIHHASGFGGAPKSMSYIIKNLDNNRYVSKLINIEEGPINKFFKDNNIHLSIESKIRPFHGSTVVEKDFKLFIRNWIFLIPSIIRSIKLLKKEKPDLIHLNSTCLFPVAIAANKVGIKVICHVREPLRKGIWGAPLRFFCKKYIDGFIAICENDLKSLRIPSANTKIKRDVIYNFVDTIADSKEKSSSLKKELNIAESSVVFLYLARFAKSNGWEELIEMAKESITKNSNFHFVLVGAVLPEHFQNVDNKNIHILPFRQDVNNVINGSDIFVCPFTEPHFARGVIEASALGLPIIGANIGGVNELIKHNETGFLYNNKQEFLNFSELLGKDDELYSKMSNEGILFAKHSFNLNKNLKRTYDFYKKNL